MGEGGQADAGRARLAPDDHHRHRRHARRHPPDRRRRPRAAESVEPDRCDLAPDRTASRLHQSAGRCDRSAAAGQHHGHVRPADVRPTRPSNPASVTNPDNYLLLDQVGDERSTSRRSSTMPQPTAACCSWTHSYRRPTSLRYWSTSQSELGQAMLEDYSIELTAIDQFYDLVDIQFSNARSERLTQTISYDVTLTNIADQNLVLPMLLMLDPRQGFRGAPQAARRGRHQFRLAGRPERKPGRRHFRAGRIDDGADGHGQQSSATADRLRPRHLHAPGTQHGAGDYVGPDHRRGRRRTVRVSSDGHRRGQQSDLVPAARRVRTE